MSVAAELLYSRRLPQVAVLALISFSFAGCRADMSSRMSQSNFSNPFAQESTGSVQQAPPPQRELPQYSRPQTQPGYYQSQPLPPAVSAPQSYPVAAGGVSGGGRGVGSHAPPAQPHLATTAPPPAPPRRSRIPRPRPPCRRARLQPPSRSVEPRSSSAPAIRSTCLPNAIASRRRRSSPPTAIRGRARSRPASN